jgi:predicted SnoaL-like aldol condensation-catalyzing enzyme
MLLVLRRWHESAGTAGGLRHHGPRPKLVQRNFARVGAVISHKEAAISFLRLVASGKVDEAYSKYVGAVFRHHNPFFRGDRESLMNAMIENAVKNPNKIFEVKRALEDGNLVAVHSHVRQKPEDTGAAVVHIFHFENGRIAEFWDLGQPIPRDSPNENGMF